MNPSGYSNQSGISKYLPSKKILIALGAIVVIVALYIGVPRVIATMRHKSVAKTPTITASSAVIVTPVGDPVTRDTLNDGIPDWEKIAVGLNPSDPKSTAEFKNFSTTSDPATLKQIKSSTDTDKVSYTIFNNIKNAANQSGALSDSVVTDQTNQELSNYAASLAPADIYTTSSLKTVDDSPANQAAYKQQINAIGSVDLFNASFQKDLALFLSKGSNNSKIDPVISKIQSVIPKIASVPTPAGIVAAQVGNLNAMNGFVTILKTYDTTNTDPLYQFTHESLIQMYETQIIKNSATILVYYNDPRAKDFATVTPSQP